MIADVAFDAPVTHPFSYRVPEGWPLAPGQRVLAPLRGAVRVGMVVALREGDDARLKLLHRIADPAPILSPTRLDFVRWIAAESLSSVGSTSAALLPPPLTDSQGGGLVIAADVDAAARWAPRVATLDRVARLESGLDEAARPQPCRLLPDGSARR